ncbi:hypothetical protein ACFSTH_13000 [Paenibacillus yanchengensis]|uniref:Uncharacterized protein n=1 Tax=Paenibacillus yanchengensis TaxID=2035833 RepID=A0ABW4YP97_9BACL
MKATCTNAKGNHHGTFLDTIGQTKLDGKAIRFSNQLRFVLGLIRQPLPLRWEF